MTKTKPSRAEIMKRIEADPIAAVPEVTGDK